MGVLTAPSLARLLLETRLALNQPKNTNSFWSDPELTIYLNDGVRQYALELSQRAEGQFCTQVNLDVVSGVETVALPSDCFVVKGLWVVQNNRNTILPYKNNEVDSYDTNVSSGSQGYEPYYFFRGNNLVLRPAPGFSQTAALVLEYMQFADNMIDVGDTLNTSISPMFKELVVAYAVYKAKLKESLVNGNQNYQVAEGHMGKLYAQFELTVGERSKYPQFVRPYSV